MRLGQRVRSFCRPIIRNLRTWAGDSAPLVDPEHRALVKKSNLFDERFYIERNPDVASQGIDPLDHYLSNGWRERRAPSLRFDIRWYLREYRDVAEANIEPILHYLRHGAKEGRRMSGTAEPSALVEHSALVKQGAVPPTIADLRRNEFDAFVADRCKGLRLLFVGGATEHGMNRAALSLAHGAMSARVIHDRRSAGDDERFAALLKGIGVRDAEAAVGARALNTETPGPFWSELLDGRRHWTVLGHLYDPDIANKVGNIDAIVISGAILHEIECLHMLRRAAQLTREFVFLDVPITPSFDIRIDNKRVAFSQDDAVFAGALTAERAEGVFQAWRQLGVNLSQFENARGGLTPALAAEKGLEGVWWWFFGLDGMKRMLKRADLEAIETQEAWDGRAVCICARKIA